MIRALLTNLLNKLVPHGKMLQLTAGGQGLPLKSSELPHKRLLLVWLRPIKPWVNVFFHPIEIGTEVTAAPIRFLNNVYAFP